MIFIDLEHRRRLAGKLEPEKDQNGFEREVLVLTPLSPGGKPRRVGPYDHEAHALTLLGGTAGDMHRLHQAGYCISRVSEEVTRKYRRRSP